MSEFKKRLKYIGCFLLFAVIFFGVVFGITGLAVWLIPEEVVSHIAGAILGLMLLLIVVMIVVKVIRFINWLFVEPFRKGRAK
ncbi:hypothetical protein ACFU1R_20380 [Priestia megaterium]|uniref:hypothetical protein n=1 Tax=Priestia megaterium TaxID=1404 RepID=UPI00366D58D9